MKKIIPEHIRRAELLALLLNRAKITKNDVCSLFAVEEVTVNRDIAYFRKNGIPLYVKKSLLVLSAIPSANYLLELASVYLPIKESFTQIQESLSTLEKVSGSDFYIWIVLIQKCIFEKTTIQLELKSLKETPSLITVLPVKLFTIRFNWILNAIDTSTNRQQTIYLSVIEKLTLTKAVYKLDESKTAQKHYHMKFRFKGSVTNELKYKVWFDNYKLKNEDDGSIILVTKQPISNSLCSWCISWWDQMQIIEPEELKDTIAEMITDFINVNKLKT